jgi:Bardet-Biedl syndrome 2 protein
LLPSLAVARLRSLPAVDGKHPSLAAATTGGRILLHTPHELGGAGAEEAGPSSSKQPLRFLNINREVTALATGRLLPGSGRDALLVGTASSFQAYDVGENRDVFFREVPDAVTAAVVGAWGSGAAGGGGAPLAFAGGNCSIQGYDGEGGDAYWTVAGDVVAAAAFGDVDGDGRPELLVGGDDFDIRLYKGEEAAREVTETDRVACLLVCPGARFAYALANGTVGVYAGASFTRAWRVKGRARPTCLCLFDIDGDGAPELLAGYADGRFEARRVGSGEVVYRDGIGAAVAGLAATDYRGDGREVLLVVGADGEVRGYGQSDADTLAAIRTAAAGAAAAASVTTAAAAAASAGAAEGPAAAAAAAAAKKAADAPGAAGAAGADIAALLCERAQLEGELRALEVLQAGGGGGSGAGSRRGSSLLGGGGPAAAAAAGALPASTDVSLALTHNVAARRLELVATCSAEGGSEGSAPLLLRSLAVYALDAGVLGSGRESVVAVSPLTLAGGAAAGVGGAPLASPPNDAAAPSGGGSGSSSLSVPLAPASNVATELRVQAVVGAHHSSAHYAVICRPFALPKFAMFALLSGAPALAAAGPAPRGLVSLELPERAQRVSMWLQAAFGLRPEQVPVSMSSPALEVRLLHLRSGRPISVSVAAEHGGAVALACDEMGLAGELVQDMAAYLALPELRSTADFPEELAGFRRTLEAMGELTAIRARLTGDSAAASGEVKALVIGAEDARLLGDMGGLRRCYGQLRALHGELVGEYAKRANNHAALVGVLKEVNQMIQKAANLRGEWSGRVKGAQRRRGTQGAAALRRAGRPDESDGYGACCKCRSRVRDAASRVLIRILSFCPPPFFRPTMQSAKRGRASSQRAAPPSSLAPPRA